MISLFDLSGVQFGGWASFTAHLALRLEALDEEVRVFRVGGRTENKVRAWRGIGYQNLSQLAALAQCESGPALMTAVGKKQAEFAGRLAEAGAKVVLHDPTEKHVAELAGCPTVVIREANMADGRTFLSHPYQVGLGHPGRRCFRAVAYSRLDWDKRTGTIVEANELLADDPSGRFVELYGAENRLYTHHRLGTLHPDWRDHYHGQMPSDLGAGVTVASMGELAVDLSVIVGDGGGTQYTHLEAFEAEAALVLHSDWNAAGSLGWASTAVSSAEELADLVASKAIPDTIEAGAGILRYHASTGLANDWLDWISA